MVKNHLVSRWSDHNISCGCTDFVGKLSLTKIQQIWTDLFHVGGRNQKFQHHPHCGNSWTVSDLWEGPTCGSTEGFLESHRVSADKRHFKVSLAFITKELPITITQGIISESYLPADLNVLLHWWAHFQAWGPGTWTRTFSINERYVHTHEGAWYYKIIYMNTLYAAKPSF